MDKRGQIWDRMAPWLIGLAVLAILGVSAFLIKDKLFSFGDYIKQLLRR